MVSVFVIAAVNLVLQIFLIVWLLTSYFFKRRGRFFLHGTMMLIGVVLNAFSFLLVMLPSFLYYGGVVIPMDPFGAVSLVVAAHVGFGSVAEALGVFLVGSWRLRRDTTRCRTEKRKMLLTIILWLIALSLGILLFFMLYG